MFKFIIQFLFFFWIWNMNRKKKGDWFAPSSFLLGLYALGAALAIPTLFWGYYTEPYSDHYWLPMVEFTLWVLLFIAPFIMFNEKSIRQIILPSRQFLDFFSAIIIILSFYAIFYYVETASSILTSGDIREIRNMISAGEDYSEGGILNTIASVSSSFYVFAIVLFFIYIIIDGFKARAILLLISSLSETIHVLTFAGRDGIVFWIFSFAFFWMFFYKFLPAASTKKIKTVFLRMGIILLIPLMMISVSRFERSDDGTLYSMVSYIGQSFVNGPLYFGLDEPPVSHAGFTLVNEILHRQIESDGPRVLMEYGDWKSWTFGTLVVSLYRKLGGVGLAVFGIGALLLFMRVIGKRKPRFKTNHLILYLLYFQVVGEGVFYFRQYTRGGNLFILLCLFGALFANLFLKSQRPVVLYHAHK